MEEKRRRLIKSHEPGVCVKIKTGKNCELVIWKLVPVMVESVNEGRGRRYQLKKKEGVNDKLVKIVGKRCIIKVWKTLVNVKRILKV